MPDCLVIFGEGDSESVFGVTVFRCGLELLTDFSVPYSLVDMIPPGSRFKEVGVRDCFHNYIAHNLTRAARIIVWVWSLACETTVITCHYNSSHKYRMCDIIIPVMKSTVSNDYRLINQCVKVQS